MTEADIQLQHKLIQLLQMAYSGEKSAAFAYQGHAAAVKCPHEKAMILKIEQEEWDHRERVGEMLIQLGSGPCSLREVLQVSIGRTLKLLCPLSGWFLPMYCAGKLEENNIEEYAKAAEYATTLGLTDMAADLMKMSVVEREHAESFQAVTEGRYPAIFGLSVFLGALNKVILLGKSN